MPAFTWAQLLNKSTDGTDAGRPAANTADYRLTMTASSASEDSGLRDDTTTVRITNGTTAPTGTVGKKQPGDHLIPVPYNADTPEKALGWLARRAWEEGVLNSSPPSNFISRVSKRLVESADSDDQYLEYKFQITYRVNIADEVSDPSELSSLDDFNIPSGS